LSEREALLPRMNAGAPTERHSHFLTKPANALLSRMWGAFHRAASKKLLPDGCRYNVKRAGGTPALRKGSLRRNEVRGLLCAWLRLPVRTHESQATNHESRVFLFVGFFVFDVALGVGVDGVLVGVG
jgi:hypothetical protein